MSFIKRWILSLHYFSYHTKIAWINESLFYFISNSNRKAYFQLLFLLHFLFFPPLSYVPPSSPQSSLMSVVTIKTRWLFGYLLFVWGYLCVCVYILGSDCFVCLFVCFPFSFFCSCLESEFKSLFIPPAPELVYPWSCCQKHLQSSCHAAWVSR